MPGTREIPLTRGGVAIIDADDYELISSFGKWYLNDTGYAIKKTKLNGKNITYRMHRVVNQTPPNLFTDHINGNRLDNRKANLRTATQAMNTWNRNMPENKTVYPDLPRGVTFDYQRGKFLGRKVIAKRFETKEEAIAFVEGK